MQEVGLDCGLLCGAAVRRLGLLIKERSDDVVERQRLPRLGHKEGRVPPMAVVGRLKAHDEGPRQVLAVDRASRLVPLQAQRVPRGKKERHVRRLSRPGLTVQLVAKAFDVVEAVDNHRRVRL
jgi:hypothetical protein